MIDGTPAAKNGGWEPAPPPTERNKELSLAWRLNQRMVKWSAGTKLWAWTISISAHLLVFAAFGLMTFSHLGASTPNRPIPAAALSHVSRPVEAAAVMPKPKVRQSRPTGSVFTDTESAAGLAFDSVFFSPRPQSPANTVPHGLVAPLDSEVTPQGVDFFGSRTAERRICYVVDCSGSMAGMMQHVRNELAQSIRRLLPDQYFCVIFFGSGRLFCFSDSRMTRATADAKADACRFIDSIEPAGSTNAMQALEATLKMRDPAGAGPSVLYFLTDGFELAGDDAMRFSHRIAVLRRSFAPTVKINTIGFWPDEQGQKLLQKIADQSAGQFIAVKGAQFHD